MRHRDQVERDRQAELRASEEKLRLALEAARMGTWEWNIETGAVGWSGRVEPMFGLLPGGFRGSYEAYLELVHPDDRPGLEEAIRAALAGETPDYEVLHRIVAPDGTTHRGEILLVEALRALLYEVSNGRGAVEPVVVTHPAHWRPATVEALRGALSQTREFATTALVSDATAAVTALRDDPGLPTSGLIAVCDFGGSGTSITLVDAAGGQALPVW